MFLPFFPSFFSSIVVVSLSLVCRLSVGCLSFCLSVVWYKSYLTTVNTLNLFVVLLVNFTVCKPCFARQFPDGRDKRSTWNRCPFEISILPIGFQQHMDKQPGCINVCVPLPIQKSTAQFYVVAIHQITPFPIPILSLLYEDAIYLHPHNSHQWKQ